eukprot:TRINITY_DN18242_c0_g1_i2.p1 TRINITY_DN18242_c0_g1~~TRINITY_DN18242_c0_g1_i2.p1  ORF type:complete len:140 (-),score=29.38 TRINITY_DN18242_c0_g1_i2:84-503(-)
MHLYRWLAAALCACGLVPSEALDASELSKLGACKYCKYCKFCDECRTCPCSPEKAVKNRLCSNCQYCKYCPLCKVCTYACAKGGGLDTAMTKVMSALESIGLGGSDSAESVLKDAPSEDEIDKVIRDVRGEAAVPKSEL